MDYAHGVTDPSRPVSAKALAALRRRLLRWYAREGRDLPWRHTTDPYAVLVSEVMLQQTQVARVVPRYRDWLSVWPTLEALAAAPLGDVLRRWQGLGYNNRAQRLHACAAAVVAAAGGRPAELPLEVAEMRLLPGIGPYTARAVLIFAHNADLAAVDANVRRVLVHELALPPDLSPRNLQEIADAAVPRGRSRDWHNALMDYGALVLTTRATGISSTTRQSAFEGSRRQARARLLRAVLEDGPLDARELGSRLDMAPDDVETLASLLARDGLVRCEGGLVSVA